MIRPLVLVVGAALVCAVPAVPVAADDPPKKLTPEERKELEAKWLGATIAGGQALRTGKLPEAVKAYEEGLAAARRLYNAADFPDGHPVLAGSLSTLAAQYETLGRLDKAEPLFAEALAMYRRLFKGDHVTVASSLNSLAGVCRDRGQLDKAEPLFTDALAMLKRLFPGDHLTVATALNNLGLLYHEQGRWGRAEPMLTDALAMLRRLFKGDHSTVATNLNNLAALNEARGQLDKAEALFNDALAMRKRLFEGDHPDVALSLNNLAGAFRAQGQLDKAEALFNDALALRKRLFKGDHPAVAASLNGLAGLYFDRGQLDKAEPLFTDALAMNTRLFKGDHPDVATNLNNLAQLGRALGRLGQARSLHADALAMRKRLFEGDHPAVASSLNNLGGALRAQGQLDKAEPPLTEALATYQRLFPGDHPDVANALNQLAALRSHQGKADTAEDLYATALAMQRRLMSGYATSRSVGDALNYADIQGANRDGLLSLAQTRAAREPSYDPGTAYPRLWNAKGTIARVFERRQLQSRASASDPALGRQLDQLAGARRARAELLLAPKVADPGTQKAREAELAALDTRIADLTKRTAAAFAPAARADTLDAATLADLRKALPAGAALVDYARYTLFGWDDTRPAGQKEPRSLRYVAFVVTREKVTWVDLDSAAAVEPALTAWRAAITAGTDIAPKLPAQVRALVWEPVRKHLPANTKTVFVCPDAALCALPFAALPGDQPGTVLLEDFAVATVPHAPFLLDKLWPQDPPTSKATGALVVGGVNFDAQVRGAKIAEPLVKAGVKKGWGVLPNTVGELNGIGRLASEKKYAVTRLEGDKATTAAVLDALPKAKVAHFATHGFFADPSFRGIFQLDERDFQKSLTGERIGRIANNPLLMTGLVCAGANAEGTPGRGVLTGDALIDRDLSGLELAVLSACETGLGDLGAGGEGVFGLQRAFHYAGAKNVVASLWKVPDAPTAALMSRFYTDLWEKNLPPIEALRQAQLHIYRNPGDVPELAKGFRGKFEEVKGAGDIAAKPQGGKAHPLLWAAFSLSGTGK